MPEICYKKNYLKEVIAVINFAMPIKALNKSILPDNILEILKARYPIPEPTKAFSQEIIFNVEDKTSQTNNHEFQQFVYHSSNKEKTITINQNLITVSIKNYKNYDEFKLDVIEPIEEISKLEGEAYIIRTGLRYVNVFQNKTNKYNELIKKFNPMIISPFRNIVDEENLSRLINISEYTYDEIKCRVQSGIFNPDFPAKIKNREFVLDIDTFIDTPHIFFNIENLFDSLHNVIQSKFESSITDKLRSELDDDK